MGVAGGKLRSNISDHETSLRDNFSKDLFIPANRGNLDELYEIDYDKLLGSGGYGNVFKALDRETNCLRAIKSVSKRKDGVFSLEYCREMAILKKVDHPNVVKLYETLEDTANMYLVMEYLEGGELFEKVSAARSFSEVQAAGIMKQIFSGIYYLHKKKIVHRDLKPENFMFRDDKPDIIDNCLKIIDFGLSTTFRDGQVLTSRTGTPYFIAPEVLNRKYSYECDIWSAGVLMYILLCGYPPFRFDTTKHKDTGHKRMYESIKRGKYCFRDAEWASISEDAKSLIRGMLTLDVAQRFTAQDCLRNLWIQQLAPNSTKFVLPPEIIKRMGHFASLHKLKKMAIHAVAVALDDRQLKDLPRIFRRLDTNGDGMLSVTELEDGLKQVGWLSFPQELNNIFRRTDSNGNGVIDFSEFVAATVDLKHCIQENDLWAAFRIFDTNGDGIISAEEFRTLSEVDGRLVNELVTKYGKNYHNGVDFYEFMEMMRSLTDERTKAGGLFTRSAPLSIIKIATSLTRKTQSHTLDLKKSYSPSNAENGA